LSLFKQNEIFLPKANVTTPLEVQKGSPIVLGFAKRPHIVSCIGYFYIFYFLWFYFSKWCKDLTM